MDDRQSWKIESKSLFDIGPRFGGPFFVTKLSKNINQKRLTSNPIRFKL